MSARNFDLCNGEFRGFSGVFFSLNLGAESILESKHLLEKR